MPIEKILDRPRPTTQGRAETQNYLKGVDLSSACVKGNATTLARRQQSSEQLAIDNGVGADQRDMEDVNSNVA